MIARENYRRDPEKHRFERKYKRHGLTESEFSQMIIDQNNKCDICGIEFNEDTKAGYICVDHDHNCCQGVRGLLCNRCNMSLGLFSDSQTILLDAIGYLEKYRERDLDETKMDKAYSDYLVDRFG